MTQSYRTVTKTREMNTEYDNSLPHQDRTHYSSQNHGPTRYTDDISQRSQFKTPLTERPLDIAPWLQSQNNLGWKKGPYPNPCSKQA